MECKHILKLELDLIEQVILRAIVGSISPVNLEELLKDKEYVRLNLPLDKGNSLVDALFAVTTPATNIMKDSLEDN